MYLNFLGLVELIHSNYQIEYLEKQTLQLEHPIESAPQESHLSSLSFRYIGQMYTK
jgi:hypothetical protein